MTVTFFKCFWISLVGQTNHPTHKLSLLAEPIFLKKKKKIIAILFGTSSDAEITLSFSEDAAQVNTFPAVQVGIQNVI